ncbi:MAG: filamentous hemagglutinin N-terminal domain-containing protein, partial [Candidatus Omnitrophota bacterium]
MIPKSKRELNVVIMIALILLSSASFSFALPTVDEIKEGTATITVDESGTNMTINASNNAIINYSSFNINENESLNVMLPDASSQILNRVTGSSMSNIYGSLTCNGLFVLVNVNGINVGPNAHIDAARLILSTRDISDSDFL